MHVGGECDGLALGNGGRSGGERNGGIVDAGSYLDLGRGGGAVVRECHHGLDAVSLGLCGSELAGIGSLGVGAD